MKNKNSEDFDKIFEVFVSMPYGKDDKSKIYWNKFYKCLNDMKQLFDGRGYTVNFIRAKETPSALMLKESVKTLIDRCHICLAVITGLNPNVFWEVGYAESRGKPTIFLVEEDVSEAYSSPVLVAEALKELYNGNIFEKTDPDQRIILDFQQKLLRFFDIGIKVVRGQEKPPPQYRILNDRQEAQLPETIINANKTIDLITTNLSYYANLEKFVSEYDGKEDYAFDPPVKRNVRVRILTLNPESIIAEYRAKQLGREHEVAEYREELRKAARFFYHRYMNNKNVNIRIYDDLPSQITLIVDRKVITSFVSRGQQARFNIHVEFDIESHGARATFEKHFGEVLANLGQTTHISHFSWAQKNDS